MWGWVHSRGGIRSGLSRARVGPLDRGHTSQPHPRRWPTLALLKPRISGVTPPRNDAGAGRGQGHRTDRCLGPQYGPARPRFEAPRHEISHHRSVCNSVCDLDHHDSGVLARREQSIAGRGLLERTRSEAGDHSQAQSLDQPAVGTVLLPSQLGIRKSGSRGLYGSAGGEPSGIFTCPKRRV